jgi:hypothetical protein
MTRVEKMLQRLQNDAAMSKFHTRAEHQAYHSAIEDMLTMLSAVPLTAERDLLAALEYLLKRSGQSKDISDARQNAQDVIAEARRRR